MYSPTKFVDCERKSPRTVGFVAQLGWDDASKESKPGKLRFYEQQWEATLAEARLEVTAGYASPVPFRRRAAVK